MRLNFKLTGKGTPVVILHGLFGSLDNWQTFARKLSLEFQVFTLDLRNHGRSPHSNEHSYEVMATDVNLFFEEHQIEKAHIIGHSMGGKAAMQFAISFPEKILKLIIVDIAPKKYGREHDVIFNSLAQLDLAQINNREDADAKLAIHISDFAVRQFLLKNLDRNPDGSFSWKMNLGALINNYESISNPLMSEHSIQVPAFVIRGEKSQYVADEDRAIFQKIFPNTQFITIPSAGHWVHAEAPDAFYAAVHAALI